MREHYIRTLLGDKVLVELSRYDPSKGRVVYRYKKPFERRRSWTVREPAAPRPPVEVKHGFGG